MLAAGSVLLIMAASPASAAQTRIFVEEFGSAAKPTFTAPKGLALHHATGDLLVIDTSAKTVSRYHGDGTPSSFAALGTHVIDAAGGADQTPQNNFEFPTEAIARQVQVAIDESGGATDGAIYVALGVRPELVIFSNEGQYLGRLTAAGAAPFGQICGVGVDEDGAVFVGDKTGKVHRFESQGAPHSPLLNTDHVASFSGVSEPCTLAAGAGSTDGSLFVTGFSGFTLFK